MKKDYMKHNVFLSKEAQRHIPGATWSKDDPQIQMEWKQFEDFIKIITKELEDNCNKYTKILEEFSVNIENIREADEAYDETLSSANSELMEIAESLDPVFYDIFHNIVVMNSWAKKK